MNWKQVKKWWKNNLDGFILSGITILFFCGAMACFKQPEGAGAGVLALVATFFAGSLAVGHFQRHWDDYI